MTPAVEGGETYSFHGEVDERGKVHPDEVNVTRGRLAKWAGKRVTVTVRRYIKSKTNPQLAIYFGPVIEAWCEYTGYTDDEMDRELRLAFLGPQLAIAHLTGQEVNILPSLKDRNVEEMSTFVDRCIREGHQRGIVFRFDPGVSVKNA